MIMCDFVLTQFQTALVQAYGERVVRIVLFGSRARGDTQPDADYDVAVFLKDMENRWAEFDRLARIEADILATTGAVVHTMPYCASAYQESTPLMQELRREGVDLFIAPAKPSAPSSS